MATATKDILSLLKDFKHIEEIPAFKEGTTDEEEEARLQRLNNPVKRPGGLACEADRREIVVTIEHGGREGLGAEGVNETK